jgi:hypothetical protein
MYKYSDVQAFIAGEKTQKPFLVSNFGGTSDYKGKTFSGFVDFLSGATPFVPSTRNKCKKYTVCLNPDTGSGNGTTLSGAEGDNTGFAESLNFVNTAN